jgi:tRNA acetyltransferase TAN1
MVHEYYLAIIPKTRNNTHIDRKKVIEAIASIIEPHHIVDLNNPQIVILVQVFKTVCGVGIVTDYYKRRALNLDEIAAAVETVNPKDVAELTRVTKETEYSYLS